MSHPGGIYHYHEFVLFLQVLFFLHVYLGKQIYISWLHKVVILFIIIGCLFATIALLVYMPNAWMLTYLFLNVSMSFQSLIYQFSFRNWAFVGSLVNLKCITLQPYMKRNQTNLLQHHWVIIHPIITTLLVPIAYAYAKAFFRSEKRGE